MKFDRELVRAVDQDTFKQTVLGKLVEMATALDSSLPALLDRSNERLGLAGERLRRVHGSCASTARCPCRDSGV